MGGLIGPPLDYDLNGGPDVPLYLDWDDAWDDAVDSGLVFDWFSKGDKVWTWWQGYWWRSIVYARNPYRKTLSIKFYDTDKRVPFYKPRLVKFRND